MRCSNHLGKSLYPEPNVQGLLRESVLELSDDAFGLVTMVKQKVRLRWKGNIEAQRQCDDAYAMLKPKNKKGKNCAQGVKNKKRSKKQKRRIFSPDRLAQVDLARQTVKEVGIEMRVNEFVRGGGFRSLHVMFYAGKVQILQWWPLSGTVWNPRTGEKFKMKDGEEVAACAIHRVEE